LIKIIIQIINKLINMQVYFLNINLILNINTFNNINYNNINYININTFNNINYNNINFNNINTYNFFKIMIMLFNINII